MGPDIRLPLGAMFALLGVLLSVFGLTSSPATYAPALGINVNLWWGLVLLAFGLTMFLLGRRSPTDDKTRRGCLPATVPRFTSPARRGSQSMFLAGGSFRI